jgi:ABC-type Na+ transport system ATPase subunit NatA
MFLTQPRKCDSFVILHQGQVRATGNLEELQHAFNMKGASLNEIYLALTQEGVPDEGNVSTTQKGLPN